MKENLDVVLSDLGRTAKGALFLRRLVNYWWPKATVRHDGEFWIYKHGREEWVEELKTTLRTFERIVTNLQANGLIETRPFQRVNKKGKAFGAKVQHVRPTEHLLNLIKDRTGKDIEEPSLAKPDQTATSKPTPAGMPKPMGVLTVAELSKIWTAIHIELYPKTYSAGFTNADKGMFSQLVRAWPPGYTGNVLTAVLRGWYAFCSNAKAQGAFPIPDHPQLRFLTRYPHIAATYWMQKESLVYTANGIRPDPNKVSSGQHNKTLSTADAQPAPKHDVEDDDEKPMTLEEFMTFKKGDELGGLFPTKGAA